MSKPIEPGCLARVIEALNPENLGNIVKVLGESLANGVPRGQVYGEVGQFWLKSSPDKYWLVQPLLKPLVFRDSAGNHPHSTNLAPLPDHKLERIDDISDDEPDTLVVPLPSKESTYV